ncbi:MAG TPA: hypothetical protein VFR67_06175 [Pilimelia sp.]|nr:hypothetical protein [Pilimelia sp.]
MTEPTRPAGYRALHAATNGLMREVVELHKPERYGFASWACHGCDGAGYDWEPPDWPCSTSELIAERLGISLREQDYTVDGSITHPTPTR